MLQGVTTFALIGYAAVWLTVAGLLAAMCATDVRTRRIPNKLVASVCAAWVALQVIAGLFGAATGTSLAVAAQGAGVPQFLLPLFALPHPGTGVLTAAAAVLLLAGAGALYERAFRKPSMGAGDVKLIGAFALFLGPVPTVACLMLACLFALAAALPARLRAFPFAPALIVAFVCVIFVEL